MSRRSLILAAALAVATPAMGSATAPWQTSSATGGDAGDPQPDLAVAPSGPARISQIAQAAQVEVGGPFDVGYRSAGPLGALGPPTSLATSAAADVEIASEPGGAALIAWNDTDGVHARFRAANGSLGPAVLVLANPTGRPVDAIKVALVSPGRAVLLAAFRGAAQNSQVVGASATGGNWGAPTILAGALVGRARIDLAMNSSGRAVAAIAGRVLVNLNGQPASRGQVTAHALAANGTWSKTTIGTAVSNAISVGLGDNGRTTVGWVAATGANALITRAGNGVAFAPRFVHAYGVTHADLDTDATGRTTVAWDTATATLAGVYVQAGRGAIWTLPIRRTAAITHSQVDAVDVDVNGRGDALVGWYAVSHEDDQSVAAATLRWGAGPFGATEIRDRTFDTRNDMPQNQLALAADGQAITSEAYSEFNCCFVLTTSVRQGPAVPVISAVGAGTPINFEEGYANVRFTLNRAARVVVSTRQRATGRVTFIRTINAQAGVNLTTFRGQLLGMGLTDITVGLDASPQDPRSRTVTVDVQ